MFRKQSSGNSCYQCSRRKLVDGCEGCLVDKEGNHTNFEKVKPVLSMFKPKVKGLSYDEKPNETPYIVVNGEKYDAVKEQCSIVASACRGCAFIDKCEGSFVSKCEIIAAEDIAGLNCLDGHIYKKRG